MINGLEQLKNELRKIDEELFTIDENDLVKEYARQAALYARYSRLLADAQGLRDQADNIQDMEYASADDYYRTLLTERGEKYTEAVIKSHVQRDEDYQEAVEAYLAAERIYNTLRGVVRALNMRADMLVSMGAHLRAEQQMTGMSIKDDSNFQDAVRKARQVAKNT